LHTWFWTGDEVFHRTELLDAGGVKYITSELLKRPLSSTQCARSRNFNRGEIKDIAAMEVAAAKDRRVGSGKRLSSRVATWIAPWTWSSTATSWATGGRQTKNRKYPWHRLHICVGACCATAAGRGLVEAATLAKAYVTKAIEKGYAVGKGRVPLDHFYRLKLSR